MSKRRWWKKKGPRKRGGRGETGANGGGRRGILEQSRANKKHATGIEC